MLCRVVVFNLGVVCTICGTHLDSVFGFFLYKTKHCFDCQRNKIAHKGYDSSLALQTDENEHFTENFGIILQNKHPFLVQLRKIILQVSNFIISPSAGQSKLMLTDVRLEVDTTF